MHITGKCFSQMIAQQKIYNGKLYFGDKMLCNLSQYLA
uniref:Uncharacterized protein n=1 Tax=Anguilla anguilla TaxID=7936 RepID=A0A0E9PUD5_ANGAN